MHRHAGTRVIIIQILQGDRAADFGQVCCDFFRQFATVKTIQALLRQRTQGLAHAFLHEAATCFRCLAIDQEGIGKARLVNQFIQLGRRTGVL
ncbi:hypothetical protein D3C81_2025600 [compost metagenome]